MSVIREAKLDMAVHTYKLALERLRLEDHEFETSDSQLYNKFKASMGCILFLCSLFSLCFSVVSIAIIKTP